MSTTERRATDIASITACLTGILLLRAAAGGAGILVGLLLARLDSETPIPIWAVGLASALFYATELIGAPGFGVLSDRHGRRPFLLISPIFGAIAALVMMLVPLLPLVLGSRLFQGLSTAASAPASLGYVADATTGDATLRGRIMAGFEVTTVVGLIGGWAAGGALWDRYGLMSFVPILLAYVLSFLAFLRVRDHPSLRERHEAPQQRTHTALLGALRLPGVMGFVPAWLAINAILGAWFAHIGFQLARDENSPHQLLVGGFSGEQIGFYSVVVGVIFLVGLLAWGQALGKVGAVPSMRYGVVGMAALCPMLYLLNHSVPGAGPWVMIFSIGSAVALLIASGFTPAALAHLADISESNPRERGAMMGLYSILLGLGQLAGAMISSPFVEWFAVDGLILSTLLLTLVSAVSMKFVTPQSSGGSVTHRTATASPEL